ncbi:MAG: Hpt domain-containing protein, partial [Ramlibacter sp.]
MEASTDIDLATNDLGPLAWVLDELRKSLDSASAALRRFVRDTALARGSDMASVDGGHLRIARQQLHQAVGALEMVGLGAPAHMLRCMEAAVQKFIEKPELCTDQAAAKVERAGFALTEYLEGVLLGKPASAVALFPQYRDTQELAGADRIHPADLWSHQWRWNDPLTPAPSSAKVYDATLRSRMDQSVLKVVKTGDPEAARELARLSLALSASQSAKQPRIFWKICSGYFEALALGLLPLDNYVKRASSRILLQYAALAKGELGVSDRLAQDLVFFCSQAVPPNPADVPSLAAVRLAWGLERFQPVDYQTPQYGRFDPVLLAQARKRIVAAKETWSSLSGGDAGKLKGLADQVHLVSDSLTKLHPPSGPLARSLSEVVDSVVRTARPPGAELAMEVATAVLYLEAAFEDLDPADAQLAMRTARLAERLDTARQGGQPEALEPWMEELYRRVSDRQTMGSVVGELRGTLGELEKLLDQFFRDLKDKTPLRDAPGHLSQMRGVLSVLGLDQAAQAVLRMREAVEEIIVNEIDEERARSAGTFDKLGNNLGALGFLIDMLNYQPTLAKRLFIYDDNTGELRPLMGRTGHPALEAHAETGDELSQELQAVVSRVEPGASPENITASLDSIASRAALADETAIAATAREAAAAVSGQDAQAAAAALGSLAASVPVAAAAPQAPAPAEPDIEEDDLRDIFLEEAREVVQNGLAALDALAASPSDISELTTLRRAFHTLKGSSRMVGLTEFGEAAWSLEQVLNTWLADQKPAGDDLRILAGEAMRGFGRWTEDIAADNDGMWKASFFRGPADTLRTEHRLVALALPQPSAPAVAPSVEELPLISEPIAEPVTEAVFELIVEPVSVQPPVESAPVESAAIESFSFDIPAQPEAAAEITAEPVKADAVEAAQPDSNAFGTTQVVRGHVPEAADLHPHELPADFEFEPSPTLVLRDPPAPVNVELVEIEGIDFASLDAVSGLPEAASAAAEPAAEPVDEAVTEGLEVSFAEPSGDVAIDLAEFKFDSADMPQPPAVEAVVEPLEMAEPVDDQIKVIGTLRIGIPLYNVYLNEADEWSRRLATEVAEWSLELNQPVPDSTVGLAHALAGSSATVGFHALSDIARALENSLLRTQSLAFGTPQHGKAFTDAAEEIRRLLHQFAAGFLKDPDAHVIDALVALKHLEIPERADQPEEDMETSGFGELAPVTVADTPSLAPTPAFEPPIAQEPPQPEEPPPFVFAPPPPSVEAPMARLEEPVPFATPVAPARFDTRRSDIHFEHEQEELDIADAVDPDLFPIFEEEAVELMPQLGGAMRQWSARPDNRSARDEVLRALHTLKGSARLAGALRLGELAHRMESEIEQLSSDGTTAADLEPLLQRF